ncbi:Fur family transcriptional regulator [Streptomyces sp. NBRC 110028]|uniref:Fur family transcriptional regulator n=1 Tax=Streptomyces sp. NBRC 110028 TaxID=1621260 RepID=UPI0006E2F5C9|nr:Fur family transcriptional regulator [Streptomyces sp. NBRC 110028]
MIPSPNEDRKRPAPSPAEILRAAGLRATGPRRAVLAWLGDHPHATADEVLHGIRAGDGSVSRQSVYNVLGSFVTMGLARCVQPAGHPARFERRAGDNHHHFVCRDCGRTEDVECVMGAAPCLTAGQDARYVVDEAEITFWGRCPSCSEDAAPAV